MTGVKRIPARGAGRLPGRAGVGFKPEHFDAILAGPREVGFFEVHAENYMGAGGPPHRRLAGDCGKDIRCRCMGSACRSARRARSTASIWRASPSW